MADLSEIGTTGLVRSGGVVADEFLTELAGAQGRRTYREMRDNDPIVGAILYSIEQVIKRLDWVVSSPVGDAESEDFVSGCLGDMSESWDATLSAILSMLPYGWSFHEIVYKRRGGPGAAKAEDRSAFADGRIGWRKWPIRTQESLSKWVFADDGGLEAMEQLDPSGAGLVTIPIEKALLFRTTTAKASPEGRSLLRNAVRPWWFKRRIEEFEAIGIERDLAGLPVAYVPPDYLSSNATQAEKQVLAAIQQIVTSIKRNEQEGVVFPAMFDADGHRVMDLQLLSSGGSRQFDTDRIITRYDQRIAMTVLSDFLLLGHDRVGSFALGSSKIDLWTSAVESIARSIAEVVNQHAIPRLLELNGMTVEEAPVLKFGEVSHVDLASVGDFIQKLTAAGLLTPDATLEDYLRAVAGLPVMEQ